MDESHQQLINCPNCHAPNYAGAAICARCGTPLPPGDVPPLPPQPTYLKLPITKGNPWLSWSILAINVIVWLAMTAAGGSTDINVLLKFGAKYGPAILAGEYWRLFTTMFLHIGIMHLAFNGYALYALGPEVELFFGRNRFLVVYLLAGLISSAASYLFDSAPAAGASGAIFGLVGALAAHFYRNRELLGHLGKRRFNQLIMITVVNLIIGVTVPNIDNWAHMGGLVGGMLVGFALSPLYVVIPPGPEGPAFVRDKNSLAKSWFIIPLMLALIVALTLLGNGRESNTATNLVLRGEEYLNNGDYTNALQSFSVALDKDKTLWSAYIYRGELYMRMEDYDAALEDFETVIQAQPWDRVLSAAYSGRGRISMIEGDPKQAASDLGRAIELAPDDSYTLFIRGLVNYDLDNYAQSRQDLEQALDLGLDDPTLVSTANNVLELLGEN